MVCDEVTKIYRKAHKKMTAGFVRNLTVNPNKHTMKNFLRLLQDYFFNPFVMSFTLRI